MRAQPFSQKVDKITRQHRKATLILNNMNGLDNSYTVNPRVIKAHDGELAAMALNQNGTLLATASLRGTIVRIWNTSTLESVMELRRGTDTADINSISFSFDSSFLCVSSDKGTVHIYCIRDPKLNRTNIMPLKETFCDVCNFKVSIECPCICAFSGPNYVVGYCTDLEVIDRELKILQSLKYENVVELIEWFREKKQVYLVFEYVEWNMLQVLQNQPDGLPIDQVRNLTYQLISAIFWCHSREIIHRDIKPENLLIGKNWILKLCDFGFARELDKASCDYYTDYVATRWYRAPELLPYGKGVDVWAIGCIMAELSTGQAIFPGESDIDQLYRIQKTLGPLPAKHFEAMRANPKFEGIKFPAIHYLETLERRYTHILPSDLLNLLKITLKVVATERWTAEQCKQHEAFSRYQPKQSEQRLKRQRAYENRQRTCLSRDNEAVVPITSHSSFKQKRSNELERKTPLIDSGTDVSLNDLSRISVFIPPPSRTEEHSRASPQQLTTQIHLKRRNTQSIHVADNNETSSRTSHRHGQHSLKISPTRSKLSHREQSLSSSEDASDDQRSTRQTSKQKNNHQQLIKSSRLSNSDSSEELSIISHGKKYLKNQPLKSADIKINRQQSLDENQQVILQQQRQQQQQQHISTIPKSVYTSNGVILRKQQKDKRFKRFSLDNEQLEKLDKQNQQSPEPNIYRSSLAIVPGTNNSMNGMHINTTSSSSSSDQNNLSQQQQQQQQQHREIRLSQLNSNRDETSAMEQRPRWNRELIRSRTIDCHPNEIPVIRSSSRQTMLIVQNKSDIRSDSPSNNRTRQQSIEKKINRSRFIYEHEPDNLEQTDIDSTISSMVSSTVPSYCTSRSLEQSQKYPWNNDRRPIYGSDSHLLVANMPNITTRPFYSPTKGDVRPSSKLSVVARDSNHDVKSAKLNKVLLKTPGDRKLVPPPAMFGIYPYARNAVLHQQSPSSQLARQQTIRLPSTKGRKDTYDR
ncbi:unnamed protein product [Didymodactylos carnosus]|uniref:Protein kinase domain-containing protein n=1 Tax=Didymodactylos carnosus TaxID=1234261 RepID=A0A813NGH1_9BILA|nr:unnamed protein product [Didymodactylos carnosus]CAF0739306.1 unnamed protein product [Didymodactylos carnosus]CAF3492487.1 unnamed protein product [Didymodactylos carnosus]CAF3517469.1 unnamed protein product [Didymodactylos carnosus]